MGLSFNFYSLNLGDGGVRARFGGMYRSFFDALESCGCRVLLTPSGPLIDGDIAVVPIGGGQEYGSLKALRQFAGPAVLYVHTAQESFDRAVVQHLAPWVLFAYGTDVSSFTRDAYEAVGIPYLSLPFGSDPSVMKPLTILPQYDVVFVGSLAHARRRMEYLRPLVERFGRERVLLIGSGWEELGVPEQQVEWGPLLNVLYNLGRVCVNLHSGAQVLGPDKRLDANNRLFDLAMAGCCQICDGPALVREYFSEDEVVAADDPRSWLGEVQRLVADPERASRMGVAARERALAEHTWHARAQQFVTEAENRYGSWLEAPRKAPGRAFGLRARLSGQEFRRFASRPVHRRRRQ